jgi:hypothetical protein
MRCVRAITAVLCCVACYIYYVLENSRSYPGFSLNAPGVGVYLPVGNKIFHGKVARGDF